MTRLIIRARLISAFRTHNKTTTKKHTTEVVCTASNVLVLAQKEVDAQLVASAQLLFLV